MDILSTIFWMEMNRVLGIKEVVFIRWKSYELADKMFKEEKQFTHSPWTRYLSGSRAEGLEFFDSDVDLMDVHDLINVSENIVTSESDIMMDINSINPGFVKLYSCSDRLRSYIDVSKIEIETKHGKFLSSSLFRERIIMPEATKTAVAHGPCATYKLPCKKDLDFLKCFSCKKWPTLATEWIHRNRVNNWPPHDLIAEIVDGGCFVVPVGNPNSRESDIQWRISFSVAEKKLTHSFNHTQFLCYGLLKQYLKHLINSKVEVKDLLSSYFLKTSLFYCIEEERIEWNKTRFLDCFWVCIRRLIKWIRDEYCPNYFIAENNMFEGKIYGAKGKLLSEWLSELYHGGLHRLPQIPCLSTCCTITEDMSFNIKTEIDKSKADQEASCDGHLLAGIRCEKPIQSLNECIQKIAIISSMINISTNPVEKAILTCSLPDKLICLVQFLYHKALKENGSNKCRYKQIKALRQFLLQNCMTFGVSNGMLLLATLCFLHGSYKEVVIIVEYVVKKLGRSLKYAGNGLPICHINYIDILCGKGFTLQQKLERGFIAQPFHCYIECACYPKEIEPELMRHAVTGLECAYMPPFVYSCVLMFLSYRHMKKRESMYDILNQLKLDVQDTFFVSEFERPLANSLLTKCLHLSETSE